MSLQEFLGNLFPSSPSNTSITAPQTAPVNDEIAKAVKESGLKPMQIDKIFKVVSEGKAMPGTKEFANELGIGMEQNGMSPTATWGPLGQIRDMFSPKAQNIINQQAVANKIGMAALGTMLDLKQRQMMGPQTLQEAQTLLPGLIQPLESQRMGAPLGPGDQGPIAPFDPKAPLTPAQLGLATTGLSSLAEGKLMNAGNEVVPTSFATVQGRMLQPEMFGWGERQAVTPPDQPLAAPPGPVPQSLANKILEERGQMQRQQLKGIDFNNRLESLAAVESVKRFGQQMPFGMIAQKDPAFAAQLRQKAEIDEAKDIYSYQQAEQTKQVAPRVFERSAAERAQPVGGDIAKYGRMSPDGKFIDRPSDPNMSQTQLNKEGYIDLSRHAKEVDKLNDVGVIAQDLQKLKGYADVLFTAEPGLFNRLGQAGRIGTAKLTNAGALTPVLGSDGRPLTVGEVANLYDRQVQSMLEYYARNLKGTLGAGTEGDVARSLNTFAGSFSSKAMKDKLFSDTFKLIDTIKDGSMRTMFGNKAVSDQKKKVSSAGDEQATRAKIQELLSQGKTMEQIKAILK